MALIFNEGNIKERITKNNVENITGYSLYDIVAFCGIDYNDERYKIRNVKISGSYPVLTVYIDSQMFEMERTINFQLKEIENIFITIERIARGKNYGTLFLYMQVQNCRLVGFKRIILKAEGSYESKLQNGYFTWARLGFSPIGESKRAFKKLFKSYGYKNITMQKCMLDKSMTHIWEKYGFEWDGEFKLRKNSSNSIYLENYFKSKFQS